MLHPICEADAVERASAASRFTLPPIIEGSSTFSSAVSSPSRK
jgi:hypothetical protein